MRMNHRYVALVRHGDYLQKPGVPSAQQPYGLSEQGVQQAHACAVTINEKIAAWKVKISIELHASSLLRAWQTAKIIHDTLNNRSLSISFYDSDSLHERSVGSLANLNTAQIETILEQDPRFKSPPQGWKSDSYYCLPYFGAESLMQAGLRVEKYIKTALAENRSEFTLFIFVGHGAAMRHAAYHLDLISEERIAKLSMYHASPIFYKLEGEKWSHLSGQWKERDAFHEVLD